MTINVMLSGWKAGPPMLEIVAHLKGEGIEVPLAICSGNTPLESKPKALQVMFQEEIYSEAFACRQIADDESTAECLNHIRQKYGVALRCMTRWDESLVNVDDKLFLIDSVFLRFVFILKTNGIHTVVFGTGSPHHFYNLLLTYACEYLAVRTIFHMTNPNTNRVRLVSGIEKHNILIKGIGSDQGKMLEYLEETQTQGDVYSGDTTRILNDRTTQTYALFLFRHLAYAIVARLRAILIGRRNLYIRSSSPKILNCLVLLVDYLRAQANLFVIKRAYAKLVGSHVPKDALVVYAHYQPEATSHPDGGELPDMRYWMLLLKSLGRAIYYKEHIGNFLYHQDGVENPSNQHRSPDYYKAFEGLGISCLPVNYSNTAVFSHNNQIFTFNGTILLEAAIRGVEAYYTGFPWFSDLPGSKVVSLPGGTLLKKQEKVEFDRVVSYFDELDRCSIPNLFGFSTARVERKMSIAEYSGYLASGIHYLMHDERVQHGALNGIRLAANPLEYAQP